MPPLSVASIYRNIDSMHIYLQGLACSPKSHVTDINESLFLKFSF